MSAETPAIGAVLDGKYRLVREIAAGAMGRIVEAEHLLLERAVVIKFLLRAPDDRARRRVLREAQAARALTSEHVVRVFDVGLVGDAPYIVMELLQGCDLATLVAERGPLPVSEAVDHVIQACAGVMDAHATDVVHRDIKPSNLFLGRTAAGAPLIKVLDFGISKLREPPSAESRDAELTGDGDGTLLGSPYYMSPEQLRNPARVDGRTDVWALAVTLFFLLSGKHPFDGESVSEVSAGIHTDEPQDLISLREEVPAELARTIERALAKRPEQRTSSPAALAQELAPFASPRGRLAAQRLETTATYEPPPPRASQPVIARTGDLTATDAELGQTRPAPADAVREPGLPRWAIAGAALAIALGLGIFGWARARNPETEDRPAETVETAAPPRPGLGPGGPKQHERVSERPKDASGPSVGQHAPERTVTLPTSSASSAPIALPTGARRPVSLVARRPAAPGPSASSSAPQPKPPGLDIDGIPIVE